MPPYQHISDRLLRKVSFEPSTHCMIFSGSVDRCGYGKINGGKDLPSETLAHRAAYSVWCGEITNGMEIDHRCGNRACINPQHLEQVKHRQNVQFADYSVNHRNARKSACHRGHLFTAENTSTSTVNGKVRRKCRECRRLTRNRGRSE